MSHNYLNKSRTQELINTIRGHLSDIATVLSNLASGDARDNTKAPINHTQASNTVTSMTGYSKPQSTSAIAASDTLNEAIGKLEKGIDGAGIPNDGVLTIQQNGTTLGTFSANQAGNTTVNIEAAPAPYIISNAVNSDDGTSVVLNGLDVGITDTINYSNLFAGETYTLKTKVYNTVTQTYLSITKNDTSSTEITSTITPSTNNGIYSNAFSIDDLTVAADNTVLNVVEKLYYNNEVVSTYTSNVTVDAAISSWYNLQRKVRLNRMSNISIGDQINSSYGSETVTWDVIGKNQDTPTDTQYTNSLTLKLHNPLFSIANYGNEPEAFYYCSTELAAGWKYLTMQSSYGSSTYVTISFKLNKAVPTGGQLVFEKVGSSKVIRTYSTSKTTECIEQVSYTTGSASGSFLGQMKYSTKVGNLNSAGSSFYAAGQKRLSVEYKNSSIRQWLNSDKEAGEWWEPANQWSRPPSFYGRNGFLHDLDIELKNVIGKTQKETILLSTRQIDTTDEMAFLLSQAEVYGAKVTYTDLYDGSPYTYYSENTSLLEPSNNLDNCRIVYNTDNTASKYWLRTPDTVNSSGWQTVNTNGQILTTSDITVLCSIVPVLNII